MDEEKELKKSNTAIGILIASIFLGIAIVVQSGMGTTSALVCALAERSRNPHRGATVRRRVRGMRCSSDTFGWFGSIALHPLIRWPPS
ncbi:hypothetical protein [Methanothrix sp.]|uniref:hypothetical protein n=1 Tax=Methanothrix sp. TaxID=90426 RepID=UPI0034E19D92